jgi:hypothetical protein
MPSARLSMRQIREVHACTFRPGGPLAKSAMEPRGAIMTPSLDDAILSSHLGQALEVRP